MKAKTTETLTLDEVLGTERAADLERKMTMFVERVVQRFFLLERTGSFATPENPGPDPASRYAALRRGFNLLMFTESDIAYFLGGMPEELVRGAFEKMGQRPRVKPLLIGGRSLERWQASRIYESYDDDVSRLQIAEVLKIGVVTVTEAILQRRQIEPSIVDGLRGLYGIPDWNSSYRFKR